MTTRASSKQGRPAGKTPGKTVKEAPSRDKQANVLEIVPGRFNESDWLSLLENDDTEDFIADIFEGIWTETSKQIQQIYIRKQLLPFTLMITENALTNVIQWAFLERNEPKPTSGTFWREDSEPIPSTMDNWGEGVVPACREERPQSIEESPMSADERPATAPVDLSLPENINQIQRPSTGLSNTSSVHTPRSSRQSKKLPKLNESNSIHLQFSQEPSIKTESDSHIKTQKQSSTAQTSSRSSVEHKPYFHDVLVIHTQPPKLEPLSDLFYPPQMTSHSSSFPSTSGKIPKRHRHTLTEKASSQLGSEALASMTNITETTTLKSSKKTMEKSQLDEQHIEEAISKAPFATHAMLKSILSRPPGYRELELDENGNVVAIARLDLDRVAPKSIRVKCDVVKPRTSTIEPRPTPAKTPLHKKTDRSEPRFSSVKLVRPEQSTDVGDLIQPAPGVLYEDYRLKKGDPRRYQTGITKYTNFYDESRPLKPIAQRTNLAIFDMANDLLRPSSDEENEQESQVPKLPRIARVPPIMSASSTTSA